MCNQLAKLHCARGDLHQQHREDFEAQQVVALEQILEPPTQPEAAHQAGEETPPPPPPPRDQISTSRITDDGYL